MRREFKNSENDCPSNDGFLYSRMAMDWIRFDSSIFFRYVPASKFLYLLDIWDNWEDKYVYYILFITIILLSWNLVTVKIAKG